MGDNIKLTLILFLIPFVLSAQIEQDKINHFSCGFLIAGISNAETYNLLKDTNLKPWQSKTIALIVGSGIGILAGHAKEKYDENNEGIYNRKDFDATAYGAVFGSISVRLVVWNSIPESHVPIEELWLQDEPLVKRK